MLYTVSTKDFKERIKKHQNSSDKNKKPKLTKNFKYMFQNMLI